MATLLHDVRFAVRLLRKSPVFTFVAVATLALAIAANTVIFTGVDAVLLRPLPYPKSEQLVRLYTQFPTMDLLKFEYSCPEYQELAPSTRTLSSAGAWFSTTSNFTGGDQPVSAPHALVTQTLLPTLGVAPLLGRNFTPEEDLPNGPNVVIIGYDLWQRSFGGAPDVLGKTVQLNAKATTVVGVMPKGFDFPGNGVELWSPLQLDPTKYGRGGHNFRVLARMKPGVTIDAVNADLADVTARSEGEHPGEHHFDPKFHRQVAYSLKGEIVEKAKGLLWLMQGVVFFVLLIACANVSNLLVARADVRRGEIAVRTALGATRGRLARQFLVESLVLGACGAIVGLLLTPWALRAMLALLPEGTPRAGEIQIDLRVLLFAVASAVLASLVFGLAPIVHTRSAALRDALGAAATRATGSAASVQLRRGLIVAEIALATVLVAGAGLFVRSFTLLEHVDAGIRPEGLVTFELLLPRATVKETADELRVVRDVQAGLAALPGVTSVAVMSELPPHRQANKNDVYFVGKTRPQRGEGPAWNVDYWQLTYDDHLKTLGARLVEGRALAPTDDERGELVAIVNEAFAKRFYPGEDAVGQRVRAADEKDPDIRIVGVFADIKEDGLDQPAGTEIVFPMRQEGIFSKFARGTQNRLHFVMRTNGDPRAVMDGVRKVVADAAPGVPVARMRTMEDVFYDELARPRFLTALLLGFAGIALLMAIVGVYGVMSYSVVQRSREIGIRMALGAPPSRVLSMLLRQGLVLTTVGVGVGLALALALQRLLAHALSGLLFGASTLDPVMLAAAIAPLAAVALVACWLPARRAARIRPMLAMRVEA